MYLIRKGEKPRPICRTCPRPHVGVCRRLSMREKRLRFPVTIRTLREEGKTA